MVAFTLLVADRDCCGAVEPTRTVIVVYCSWMGFLLFKECKPLKMALGEHGSLTGYAGRRCKAPLLVSSAMEELGSRFVLTSYLSSLQYFPWSLQYFPWSLPCFRSKDPIIGFLTHYCGSSVSAELNQRGLILNLFGSAQI